MSQAAANTLLEATRRQYLNDLKFVLSRDNKMKGVVTSTSRRCSMEGCNGIRVGVRWPDGKHTFPCTKGMVQVSPDTWRIG